MRRFLLVLTALGLAAGTWLYSELHAPYGNFPEPVTFEYVPGADGAETAANLEQLGMVQVEYLGLTSGETIAVSAVSALTEGMEVRPLQEIGS